MFEIGANLCANLSLTPSEAIALSVICFAAGLVRGFTGFVLSAFGLALAVRQLAKIKISHLASQTGTAATEILAGVSRMVVALYVLVRNDEHTKMRATLVAFLFISSSTSMLTHFWFGAMNTTSTLRGLAFVLPCIIGVLIGQRLFTPRLQPYYRPTCLTLLIDLGVLSPGRSTL